MQCSATIGKTLKKAGLQRRASEEISFLIAFAQRRGLSLSPQQKLQRNAKYQAKIHPQRANQAKPGPGGSITPDTNGPFWIWKKFFSGLD
jgi:hypothetical protein